MDGATYRSKSSVCCGGVGRNLAEGIGKILGGATFISAVGDDQGGEYIKDVLHSVCNTSIITEKGIPTANCSNLFDKHGELKIITADMAVHRCIRPELIFNNRELIENAPLIVFDSNLSVECMEAILTVAKDSNVPVFFEPTDMRIAEKPFILSAQLYTQIKFASPNLYEIRNIAKFFGYEKTSTRKSLDPTVIDESKRGILAEVANLCYFLNDKIENIIITLGSLGIVVARHHDADAPFFTANGKYNKPTSSVLQLRYYPSNPIKNVVNVSGAGDSFSSGAIAAICRGLPENICIAVGFEASHRALLSKNAVADVYFDKQHQCWTTPQAFETIENKQ